MELSANTTYEYKVINNGSWTSTSTAITKTGQTVTMSSYNDNAKITTKNAGAYTFQYDTSSNKLTVIYP